MAIYDQVPYGENLVANNDSSWFLLVYHRIFNLITIFDFSCRQVLWAAKEYRPRLLCYLIPRLKKIQCMLPVEG